MNTGSKSDARILIVGAGPVGLTAAVALRQRGLAVRIVDANIAENKRTYPAIVHARTLEILHALGVGASLEWRGHAVVHLDVHVDGQQRARLHLPGAETSSFGALTLPQDVLRRALTSHLSELGTEVEWATRLVALEQIDDQVRVGLVRRERAESTELRPEWTDVAFETADYDFVIGADGDRSAVRQLLGIPFIEHDAPQFFAFADVVDPRAGTDAHLIVRETLGSSIFPLQSGFSRLSFQTSVEPPALPSLEELRLLIATRMPWYAVDERSVEWSARARFTPALAESFGRGRVFLAGDAAHVTCPLGGQSLNVGIQEALEIAQMVRASQQLEPFELRALAEGYLSAARLQWELLLGLDRGRALGGRGEDWLRRNFRILVQSLPAAGDDLHDLLAQLTIPKHPSLSHREARPMLS